MWLRRFWFLIGLDMILLCILLNGAPSIARMNQITYGTAVANSLMLVVFGAVLVLIGIDYWGGLITGWFRGSGIFWFVMSGIIVPAIGLIFLAAGLGFTPICLLGC